MSGADRAPSIRLDLSELRRELQPGFASCCFTLSRALERHIGRLEPGQAHRQGTRR